MKYTVWYRLANDGRAPEFIRLQEYKCAGTLEAGSRVAAQQMLRTRSGTSDIEDPKDLQIGDVLEDKQGSCWILTPRFVWALVTVLPLNLPDKDGQDTEY